MNDQKLIERLQDPEKYTDAVDEAIDRIVNLSEANKYLQDERDDYLKGMSDFRERCLKAIAENESLTVGNYDYKKGQRDGIKLALSYFDEMEKK